MEQWLRLNGVNRVVTLLTVLLYAPEKEMARMVAFQAPLHRSGGAEWPCGPRRPLGVEIGKATVLLVILIRILPASPWLLSDGWP